MSAMVKEMLGVAQSYLSEETRAAFSIPASIEDEKVASSFVIPGTCLLNLQAWADISPNGTTNTLLLCSA